MNLDWNIKMNRALDYIEENLSNEIDFEYAAKLAFCSRNDLSNIFYLVTGIQLSEYIRRRRLSLAALELQNSNEKIIDISLKYGYLSPTAFNRAFQNQHKVSPQYARSRKIFLYSYPRITFQIILNGEILSNIPFFCLHLPITSITQSSRCSVPHWQNVFKMGIRVFPRSDK